VGNIRRSLDPNRSDFDIGRLAKGIKRDGFRVVAVTEVGCPAVFTVGLYATKGLPELMMFLDVAADSREAAVYVACVAYEVVSGASRAVAGEAIELSREMLVRGLVALGYGDAVDPTRQVSPVEGSSLYFWPADDSARPAMTVAANYYRETMMRRMDDVPVLTLDFIPFPGGRR
jgi:hypothetical protein